MKKNIIALGIFFTLITISIKAQTPTPWVFPGNTPTTGDFVGTTNSFPLELKTTATGANAQNINIYTNNTQKMTVLGNNGSTDGYVGIGILSPNYLLHQDGGGTATATYHQFTCGTTLGTGTGDGFLIGVDNNGSATLNNQENRPITFQTNGGNRRMKIEADGDVVVGDYNALTGNNQLVQYISSTNNIYHQFTNGNTGTNSGDGFKIGITYDGSSLMNAELRQAANAPMNFLTNGTQRMQIAGGGNVGIGITAAARVLEVLDASNPQLRLTQTSATEYVDLKTTASGDLYINPVNSSAVGNVGICTSSPGARLHVAANYNTSGVSLGSKFEYTNTSGSTPGNPIDVAAISTVSTANFHDAVYALVNGGDVCRGFRADVSNTNTANATNYGYAAYVTDNASGSNSPTNVGFHNESVPTSNVSYNSVNKGFESVLGTINGGNYYTPSTMYGVHVTNYNAKFNYGVWSELTSSSTLIHDSSSIAKAIVGISGTYAGNAAYSMHENYGGYFSAVNGSHLNYGLYSEAAVQACSGAPPSTATCTAAAGFFSGDVAVTGTVFSTSDSFLKDNVQPITNAPALLNQLEPVHYNFKTQDYPSMNLEGGDQFGLIAESVSLVCPDLVRGFIQPAKKDSSGNIIDPEISYKAINYTGLIPLLIAAYKSQSLKIDSLIAALNAMQMSPVQGPGKVNNPEDKMGALEVKLSNKNSVVLNPANPNPFKENTNISFNIPADAKQAQILFYDSKGTVLNTVNITDRGEGSVLVFGSDLSSGIYTYTLLVDGKAVQTQRMVKIK